MTLFQRDAEARETAAAESGVDGRLAELAAALRAIDLETTSGIEALLWLSEWKRRLSRRGAGSGTSPAETRE
jgi:hypothetical protein